MKSAWTPKHVTRRPLRRVAVALARLLFAFVILAGIVHSGGRYFYCEAVGLSSFDPCVQPPGEGPRSCPIDTLGPQSRDCCEIITLPSTPNGVRTTGPSVPQAGVIAVVPASRVVNGSLADDTRLRHAAFNQWRPPPRPSRELRARLMVFLT